MKETEWHSINVYGNQIRPCMTYLHKGSLVFIDGQIKSRKRTDKDGIERMYFDIKARNVQFLSTRGDGDGAQGGGNGNGQSGNGGGRDRGYGNGNGNSYGNGGYRGSEVAAAGADMDQVPF